MRCDERGAGLLSTVFGLGVALAILAFASSVAISLWDRSSVESVAYEAALEVATAPSDSPPQQVRATALERACDRLAARCAGVELSFRDAPTDPMVELRVRASARGGLPRIAGSVGSVVGELDRTILVRKERR